MKRGIVLWCSVAVAALLTMPASAEVVPGRPDESIQQAYPISAAVPYHGAFDNTHYNDVDYLAFHVSQANQTLQFELTNTTQTCNDPNDAGCPVYATLMNSNDQQVGGDTSGAGTIATVGGAEVFQWTFATPGTYYVLMESNGDLTPGNPSYAVDFRAAPAGSGGTGSGTGSGTPGGSSSPLLRSFKVPPRQHGASLSATIALGQPATRLTLTLLAGPQRVARVLRRNLSAGSHRILVRLPAAYRGRRVSLLVKLLVLGSTGQRATASLHAVVNARPPQ